MKQLRLKYQLNILVNPLQWYSLNRVIIWRKILVIFAKNNVELASRQIRTIYLIFDFLVLIGSEFNYNHLIKLYYFTLKWHHYNIKSFYFFSFFWFFVFRRKYYFLKYFQNLDIDLILTQNFGCRVLTDQKWLITDQK